MGDKVKSIKGNWCEVKWKVIDRKKYKGRGRPRKTDYRLIGFNDIYKEHYEKCFMPLDRIFKEG